MSNFHTDGTSNILHLNNYIKTPKLKVTDSVTFAIRGLEPDKFLIYTGASYCYESLTLDEAIKLVEDLSILVSRLKRNL